MSPISQRCTTLLAAAATIAALTLAPAGAQERVALRGTSVTLTAPPGFTPTRDGKGLENAATGSSITVAERPAEAYAELAARFSSAKSLSDGYAGQGVTIRSVRTISVEDDSVPFAVGRQASKALTPEATNSGPIMISVPAVCSPAYIPKKLLKPKRERCGTGSRSNSSVVVSLLSDIVSINYFRNQVSRNTAA